MISCFERTAILCVLGCVFVILFRLLLELHCDKAEYRRKQNKRPTKIDELACLLLHLFRRIRLFFRQYGEKFGKVFGLHGKVVQMPASPHAGENVSNPRIHHS